MAGLASKAFAFFFKHGGAFQDIKQCLFSHKTDGRLVYVSRQGRLRMQGKRKVFRRVGVRVALTLILVWLMLPSFSQAQKSAVLEKDPPHVVATLASGGSLRLYKNSDFGQNSLAPAFIEGTVGFVLAGSGWLRHGFALSNSLNLTSDGGYTEPIYSGQQWVLMPSYMALLYFRPDAVVTGRVGPEFAMTSSSKTWGIGITGGAGYYLLAGFGVYGELGFDLFFGANSTLHPMMDLKLGILVDYEILP
jgi:hypothetical protein